MIDASSGGALINKTPEEAWELIETVADANQHFNRRATSKGVYEVAHTVLAKSLVDIVAMLKEIKEGQKYYTQGGRDGQPTRWIPSQQPQAQPRQPYTYSQPQNSQNPRYQPPHNRQQYSLSNNPPLNFDEAIRIVQRENQEMREVQKRTESQLNHLAELLQKIANQSPVNPQAQAQPLAPSPLPSQPLPNPKGGINAVQVEMGNEEEDKAEDEEGENDWLYQLLKELANSDDEDEESEDESEEEYEDESTEEDSKDEFVEEGDQAEEETREENSDKGKIFFINTLFKEMKNEEEVPIKCEDPGPCLITCKIRGVSILDCLCDPGACRNIMPFEVYELLDLGPLKKSR
ncbi:hypothetical protein PIB30_069958 [Stylosanthes scabra]|uniref:Uncharacterized protein n=1 Tax=Stylosanthes scabra TaxID=79078 RepID=A0ABU6QMY1_9FABA|nr:hypothetical protein [Stylosanthes scabra]